MKLRNFTLDDHIANPQIRHPQPLIGIDDLFVLIGRIKYDCSVIIDGSTITINCENQEYGKSFSMWNTLLTREMATIFAERLLIESDINHFLDNGFKILKGNL